MSALREWFRAATGGLPRVFWALWWGILVNRAGNFVMAFLGVYLVRERGLGAAEAGGAVALFGLGILVSGPVGGAVADRFGRRPTMLLSLAAGGALVVALAFASGPFIPLLAFLAPALGNAYAPAATAALADVVPAGERTRAWGLYYWAINLGMSVGLLLAGLVASRSLPALFLADAATTLAYAAIVFRFVPETRPVVLVHQPMLSGMGRVLADGPYAAFLLLHLAALLIFSQWLLALPLDMAAHGLGPSAFSVLMALNCVGVVVLQPVLGPRLARRDGGRLLAISAALFGIGYGLNALGLGLPGYAAGTVLWTVGEVVGFPAATAVAADLAPPELRGRYQGAFSMTWGGALMISPALSGAVLERHGARTLWLACLALSVAVSAGHLAAAGPRRRRLAGAASAQAHHAVAPLPGGDA